MGLLLCKRKMILSAFRIINLRIRYFVFYTATIQHNDNVILNM